MRQLRTESCTFPEQPDEEPADAVWVRPELVAEISYTQLTDSGKIRHGVFLGLREDKPARTVTLKAEEKAGKRIAGVTVTSTPRKVFPDDGITKGALAQYYEAVADRMLETVADRPLSLLRHPAGLSDQGFFQKHAGEGFPDAIQTVAIPGKEGTSADYMYVDDASGLVGAVQMGTIEFHIWGARRDRLERPDRMVFDLDPGPDVGFRQVRQGAMDIRDRLLDLGLESHAMVTGGKGVHVVLRLRRTATWETVKIFSHTFATIMAEKEPDRFTASMSKARRKGRIYIDWLRNGRGGTAVAPFSVRAGPGAKVAVPVSWDELGTIKSADAFDLKRAIIRAKQPQISSPLVSLGEPAVMKLQEWAKSIIV